MCLNGKYDGTMPAEEVSVCVDIDWFGDTQDPRSEQERCVWYASNSTTKAQCGQYDTENGNFIAADLCCACGGGMKTTLTMEIPI